MRTRQSFTLIELLVVVAILLPALNAARDKAHAVVCASRLKSIGTASVMYFNDGSGQFPFELYAESLRVYLHPYLPAFNREDVWWQASIYWNCPAAPYPYTVHYGMNAGVCMGRLATHCWDGNVSRLSLGMIDDPARFIWVAETGYGGPRGRWDGEMEFTWNRWRDSGVPWNLWTIVFGPLWGPPEPYQLRGYPYLSLRHRMQAGVLFLDGHVLFHGFDELLVPSLWLADRPPGT